MSNKGLLIIFSFIFAILFGVLAGLALAPKERADFLSSDKIQIPPDGPKHTFVQTEKPQIEVSVPEKYMLTLTDTQIMIYKISADGSMQIIEEKPVDKDGLRREDCENLFKGITFDTLSEARETLEDYIN